MGIGYVTMVTSKVIADKSPKNTDKQDRARPRPISCKCHKEQDA